MLEDNGTNDITNNSPILKGANNRKRMIVAIVAIAFFIVAAGAGTFLILKSNMVKKIPVTTTAETNKEDGIEAEKSGDKAKAKELFKEARATYQESGNKQGVVDMDAKLCLIGETEYCKTNN